MIYRSKNTKKIVNNFRGGGSLSVDDRQGACERSVQRRTWCQKTMPDMASVCSVLEEFDAISSVKKLPSLISAIISITSACSPSNIPLQLISNGYGK